MRDFWARVDGTPGARLCFAFWLLLSLISLYLLLCWIPAKHLSSNLFQTRLIGHGIALIALGGGWWFLQRVRKPASSQATQGEQRELDAICPFGLSTLAIVWEGIIHRVGTSHFEFVLALGVFYGFNLCVVWPVARRIWFSKVP